MAALDRLDLADLDLSPAQMQAMGEAVVARAVGHLAALRDQPSRGDLTDIAALCRALREPVPEQGTALDPLLDQLFDELIPRSFTTPGPGRML